MLAARVVRRLAFGQRHFSALSVGTTGSAADLEAKLTETFGGDEHVVVSPGKNENQVVVTPVAEGELVDKYVDTNTATLAAAPPVEDGDTWMAAIGLGTFWDRLSRIYFFAGVTAVSQEWYVFNEETFVAGCLTTGFFLMWVYGREPITQAYESAAKQMLGEQQAAEERNIRAAKTYIESYDKAASLEADVAAAFVEKAALVEAETMAKAVREKMAVKSDFERRLQGLVAQKADEENKQYRLLIADANDHVNAAILKPDFKKASLAYALAALTSPEKAGADPVAALYEKYLVK